MSCMPDMTSTLLAAAVAPRAGKIIKNGLSVFERRKDLLQIGILRFVFRFSQSPGIALDS